MPLAAIPAVVGASIIGGGAAIAGGAIAASGAKSAANAQASAADQAAELQHEDAQAALNFQEQQYSNSLALQEPWLNTGRTGLANLGYLMGLVPPAAAPGSASAPPAAPTSTVQAPMYRPARTSNMRVADLMSGDPGMAYDGSAVPAGYRSSDGSLYFPRGTGVDPGPVNATTTGALNTNGLPSSQVPQVSLSSLVNPSLGAPGSLMTPWTEQFQAPTDITEQNDPGFEARLKLGQQTLERSAAAKGNLLTGGTARDLNAFAQDYASNEYQNVYNRAFNNYTTSYNQFKQNQTDQFNRLAAMSGIGQTAASTLTGAGLSTANSVGNTLLASGQQIGDAIQNAGAARASGYAGTANAITGALNGGASSIMNGILLSQLMKSNPAGGGYDPANYGAEGF